MQITRGSFWSQTNYVFISSQHVPTIFLKIISIQYIEQTLTHPRLQANIRTVLYQLKFLLFTTDTHTHMHSQNMTNFWTYMYQNLLTPIIISKHAVHGVESDTMPFPLSTSPGIEFVKGGHNHSNEFFSNKPTKPWVGNGVLLLSAEKIVQFCIESLSTNENAMSQTHKFNKEQKTQKFCARFSCLAEN